MKLLTLIITLLCFADAAQSSRGKEGGAGIKQVIDGEVHYLTFGSLWRFEIKDPSLSATALPGYQVLKAGVSALKLTLEQENQVRLGFTPSQKRRYFIVERDNINPEIIKVLIEEYQDFIDASDQIITYPGDEIAIYAYTEGQDTYLFPEFFELSNKKSQAAILAHEGFRALGLEETEKVVELEVAFEEWLVNGENGPIQYFLGHYFSEVGLKLKGAIHLDIKNQNVDSSLRSGWLPYTAFSSSVDLTQCFYNISESYTKYEWYCGSDEILTHMELNFNEFMDVNSTSAILSVLSRKRLKIIRGWNNDYRLSDQCSRLTTNDLINAQFALNKTSKNFLMEKNRPSEPRYPSKSGVAIPLQWNNETIAEKPFLKSCPIYLLVELEQ